MCEHCREPQTAATPREKPAGEQELILCEAINHEERDVKRMLCPSVAVLVVEERVVDSHICDQHFAELEQLRCGRGIDWCLIVERMRCDFVPLAEAPGTAPGRCGLRATRAIFTTSTLLLCQEHGARMDDAL